MKTVKTVQVIARVEFKDDSRKVCYIVRASDGTSQYTTCLYNGKACSCTCAARKPCYHMSQVEAREAERAQRLDEQEYAQWKAEHGLDLPMSAEEVEQIARHELKYAA